MNTRSITAICRGCLAIGVLLGATVLASPAYAACNGNPNARIEPDNQTVFERTGGNFTVVTLDGSNSTPNNSELLFQWTYLGSTPAGLPVTLSSTTAKKPTFTSPNVPATGAALNFQLTVTCGTRSSSITTIVNVTDVFVNSPPTPSFFISPLNATEGQTVTLDGTASSDPDGQSLTYSWTQIGGLPNVTLINGNAAGSIKTFVAPNLTTTTTLTFRLTVSDGTLANSTDKSVSIVWTNDPPVAALTCPAGGVLVADEGQSVTFNAGASTDPEGGPLTYAWSQNMGLPNLGIGGFTTTSITFNTPHLGYQQLGGMTVTATVTDNQNVSASKSCGLFIKDVTAPVILVPVDDIIAEASSAAGASVPYSVTSQDAVEDELPNPLACEPPSYSLFALDVLTPVNCTDQDAAGNVANASFNIFVDDTTPPTLTVPGDTAVEAEDANGAIAHFTATRTDIVDGTAPAACTPATGSQFPLGDTTVNCTAVDAHLNEAEPKSFVLSVMDTTAPTIDPHGDEGPFEATSSAGAVATYTAPATHDAVDGDGLATCTPASGSTFGLGSTTVTCSASDAAGNPAVATTFKVIVSDTTSPVIGAHADITAEATSPAGASVSYTSPATTDIVGGVGTATCIPASASTFALGETTVHCSAADLAGNAAEGTTFKVLVVDTTAPVIAAHDDVGPIEATGPAGAVATYIAPSTSDAVDGPGTASCTPESGDIFGLGATIVTCEAVDAANNEATETTFTVNVVDTTPPEIDAHAPIGPVEATGAYGAYVPYSSPATYDLVDGGGVAACEPGTGSAFALGSNTVTCRASDNTGNAATPTTFTIEVVDTTPPVIDPHGNVTEEATGPGGASVSYDSPATSDIVDGAGTAVCLPASGDNFPLGESTVQCNAADEAGNGADMTSFKVFVVDTTAPVIGPHLDITAEATSPAGASVGYTSPATSDIVDGSGTATCAPPSASTFALGETSVQCNATDHAGNVAGPTTFKVFVVDTTAPVVTAPANVTTEATGPQTTVNYGNATAEDAVGAPWLTNNAPATFPLDTTTIIWTARDAAGNQGTATSTVTVVDTTAPALTVPGNLTREATSAAGAAVSFATSAVDLVSGTVPVNCSHSSGGTFALGSTTVACSAADAIGNTAHGNFNVTVVDTTGPTIAPHADVNATASGNSSAVVNYTPPTASDLVDGAVPVSCTLASGSSFSVGTNTVTCTAQDGRTPANVAQSTTFKVIVSYTFNGFFQPIDNNATNAAKAGSAIPVKFSLGGNQGLNIFAANSPTSQAVACDSLAPIDEVETTVTAGSSSLQYDAGAGQYIYVWKTDRSWLNCRQLRVTLRDGSVRTAMFKFR